MNINLDTLQQNINKANYDAVMPGMTEEQALYILRQPWGSFPDNVRSKAVAIAAVMQKRT